MKKVTVFLFAVSSFCSVAIGQISTTKIAPKTDRVDVQPYDSLHNYLQKDVYQYIGQDLYLVGLSESLRGYGYSGFLKDYTKDGFNKKNIFKCCATLSEYNSNYDKLTGQYFKVIDVMKRSDVEDNIYTTSGLYYLKLQVKSSGEFVYFKYDTNFEHNFPFLVVGFVDKMKQLIIGKEFILRGRNSIDLGSPVYDVNTGNLVNIESDSIWIAKDITIEERYFKLSVLLTNSSGENIVFDFDDISNEYFIIEKSNAYIYKSTFGSENWDLIQKGKVKIGMTKDMCRLSWGEPKSINETITAGNKTEQWVYSDNYLYFDNNILTAIQ